MRACELREKFASLSDYNYDFAALWSAQERSTELNSIDGGKSCWCTHVCFIHDSMRNLWKLQGKSEPYRTSGGIAETIGVLPRF